MFLLSYIVIHINYQCQHKLMIKLFNSSKVHFDSPTAIQESKVKLDILGELRDKLNKLNLSIKGFEEEITEAFDKLKVDHPDLDQEYVSANIDVQSLKSEWARTHAPEHFVENQKKVPVRDEEQKDICKKIFSELARECHPDKVQDPAKNKLFVQAISAYETLDYFSLLLIQESLLSNTFSDEDLIQEQEIALKKQISEKERICGTMLASLPLAISRGYLSDSTIGKLDARCKYTNLVYGKIKSLLLQKEDLKKKLKQD